ncbi:MAG: hypothetical protein HY726_15870 [Candidatus Rokubacteria bacterium]|nr:hypothetical protein [Candidatus Rokubacteria bacterium]
MKRTVSSILMVGVLGLAVLFAGTPVPVGSPAYAEVTEKQLMDQLSKIKKIVSDIETKMKSKKMMMDAMGMDKTMKMLADVTKMLEEVSRQAP